MDHLPPVGLMSQNRPLRPDEVTACFLGKAGQHSEMILPVTMWVITQSTYCSLCHLSVPVLHSEAEQ